MTAIAYKRETPAKVEGSAGVAEDRLSTPNANVEEFCISGNGAQRVVRYVDVRTGSVRTYPMPSDLPAETVIRNERATFVLIEDPLKPERAIWHSCCLAAVLLEKHAANVPIAVLSGVLASRAELEKAYVDLLTYGDSTKC